MYSFLKTIQASVISPNRPTSEGIDPNLSDSEAQRETSHNPTLRRRFGALIIQSPINEEGRLYIETIGPMRCFSFP